MVPVQIQCEQCSQPHSPVRSEHGEGWAVRFYFCPELADTFAVLFNDLGFVAVEYCVSDCETVDVLEFEDDTHYGNPVLDSMN